MKLNKGQKEAIEIAKDWWNNSNRNLFEFSGAPGTGKSTVAKYLVKELNIKRPLYMALTGSAVKELRNKGNFAKTIHSSIYNYEKSFIRDENNKLIIKNGYPLTRIKPMLKTVMDMKPDAIIVDECRMVPENIVNDLKSFNIPIIAMGDIDQLPPVIGNAGFFKNGVDYKLTEYMRQALDSGIIKVSKFINEGGILKPGMDFGSDVEIIKKSIIKPSMLTIADMNITTSNKYRKRINDVYREYKGYKPDMIYKDEILICRKNSWNDVLDDGTPLVNGTLGYVNNHPNLSESNIDKNEFILDFQPFYANDYFDQLTIDYKHIITSGKITDKYNYSLQKFEFGYAITVHLSQGSEYDSIFYIDDKIGNPEFMKKLRYTAMTRAKKKLGIAL